MIPFAARTGSYLPKTRRNARHARSGQTLACALIASGTRQFSPEPPATILSFSF